MRRHRLQPYPAIQSLLLAYGLSSLGALVTLDVLGPEDVWREYLGFLIVPALMRWFAVMEHAAKRTRSPSNP